MDQNFQNQTSFIPKKAVGRDSSIREKPIGLFLIISSVIFVVMLLGAGGAFLYKYSLSRGIDLAGKYLDERKSALEPATIDDLLRTDKRLRSASGLLGGHLVASPVLGLLESLTLKTVSFSRMDYSNSLEKGPIVKLTGVAKSYGTVALQADVLNNNRRFVRRAVFSNLNLDDKGNVTFAAQIDFDPDLTNYKKAVARDGEPISTQ
ncbi:MAG: hypothetical protein WC835_02210 [Candidatus Paceibacterota bacterium]|jgi:hypothetical protein